MRSTPLSALTVAVAMVASALCVSAPAYAQDKGNPKATTPKDAPKKDDAKKDDPKKDDPAAKKARELTIKSREAFALLNRKQFPEAEAAYKAVLAEDPGHEESNVGLSRVYSAQKQFDKSEGVLVDAVKAFPKTEYLRYHLAQTYASHNKLDDALKTLDQAHKDFPKSARFWVLRGQLLSNTDKEASVKAYREAVKIEPHERTALNNLGVHYIDSNRYKEAREVLETYVKSNPSGISGRFNLGSVYIASGEIDKAIALYDDLLKRRPKDAFAISGKATAQIIGGKADDALATLKPAVDAGNNQPLILQAYGLALLFKGDAKGAQKPLETSFKAGSGNLYPTIAYVELLRQLKRLDEAEQTLNTHTQKPTSQSFYKAYLALVRNDQGRQAEARKLLKEAVALQPGYSKPSDLGPLLRFSPSAVAISETLLSADAPKDDSAKGGATAPAKDGAKAKGGCGCASVAAPVGWADRGALGLVIALGALALMRRKRRG